MFIHFHSLYAGLIAAVAIVLNRPPFWAGIAVIPLCLLIESVRFLDDWKADRRRAEGRKTDRQKANQRHMTEAGVILFQSLVIFGVYALAWYLLYGSRSQSP
jgi:hypothetical protein